MVVNVALAEEGVVIPNDWLQIIWNFPSSFGSVSWNFPNVVVTNLRPRYLVDIEDGLTSITTSSVLAKLEPFFPSRCTGHAHSIVYQ